MSESLVTRLQNRINIYMSRYQNRNMSKNDQRKQFIKRLLLGLILVALVVIFSNTKVQSVLEILSPPLLPELQVTDGKGGYVPQYWIDQNWGGTTEKVSDKTQKYHHISQGTGTLPIPYDWFIHLEIPDASVWSTLGKSLLFIGSDPFSHNDYLLRFGFIASPTDPLLNPDGLPIGFSKTPSMNIPGYPTKTVGLGFGCAACHTGHFIYGKGDQTKEYVIEGAPATTDLGLLTAALGASLGQTALSSKIPFFDGRFDRFAKKVLGTQYDAIGKAALAENLASVLGDLQKEADIIEVQEGFSRLDALNRIGNQVFSINADLPENYRPIDAPVNYPFIWTSSWFKWVQYDASIMRPLVRNAGEAMGVNAHVIMTAPKRDNKFESSIPIANLVWIEDFLKGVALNEGLTAPYWPFSDIKKTSDLYINGKDLYQKRCQGCHLPVMDDPALAQHLKPIEYMKNGQLVQTTEKVLDLNVIPESQIGTDPAQGNVLITRTLSTAGSTNGTVMQRTKGLGIDDKICGRDPNQAFKNSLYGENRAIALVDGVPIKDGGYVSFGLALGAIVQQTIDAWFADNGISDPELKERFLGGRPNCFQVGQGYKARPLNGVWATAPFLHNGSVATLKDLICKPQEQRPAYIQLGNIQFDAENVGLYQPKGFVTTAQRYIDKERLYTNEGYFILNSHLPGNSNKGHSFGADYDLNKSYSDQKKGVIGVQFSAPECDAIVEYLKTI